MNIKPKTKRNFSIRAKMLSSIALFSFGIAIAPNLVFAQIAPLPGFSQERYKDFAPDSSVKYGTLPNGVRYGIQKWPTPKGEVAIRMRVGAGSLNEAENQRGLMHFLEHMAFNGSENVPEGEMDKILSREGLAFGADTNAYTSFDEVVYRLDMPKAEKLDLGLKLMRETAGRLLMDASAIDRERGVIVGEERTRENPGYRSFRAYLNATFKGLLITERLPIGKMEVVTTAPRERFVELYNDFYHPSRIFIAIVGDIDTATAENLLKAQFNDWTAKAPSPKDPDLGKLVSNPGAITLNIEPQLPTSITLTQPREYINYPDTSQIRRKFALRGLAESMLNERLERIARKEGSPILGASVGDSSFAKSVAAATMEISAKDISKWKEALEIGDTELRRALQYGFTQEEFVAALARLRESYNRAATQKNARRSADIANAIVGAFDNDSVYTSDEDELAWFNRIAPTLKPEDALKELKETWGDKLPQLFMSASSPIENGEKLIAEHWQKVRATNVPPPVREATKQWDYTNFGRMGVVSERKLLSDIGVTQIKFANNVRLIVKPTKFEAGRVRVKVRFGEGSLAIPLGNPANDTAIQASFIAGGLGRFDVDALSRTLSGKSVGTGFGVAEDAFEFAGSTTPNDLTLQMQIYAAYLTDAKWRPDGFARLKASKDAIYRQINSTPGAVWGTKGTQILRSGDSRFAFPTPEQFDALDLNDAKRILDGARANGAIEVIVVGDTTIEAATRAVASTFGALPRRAAVPNPRTMERRVSFPRGRATTVLEHEGRDDQSMGLIFWPIGEYGDGERARALRVLESIFQVRLNEVIREQEGGTYSPGSIWSPSSVFKDYGIMGASMQLKPGETDKYIAKVEEIAKDLADGKIDADLFKRAKTPLVADFEETTSNNPWWLGALENSSFDPVRLVRLRGAKSQYEKVTLDQIRALAKQYFDPSKAQIIKIMPGPKSTKSESAPSN